MMVLVYESAILFRISLAFVCFLYADVIGDGDGVEPMDNMNKQLQLCEAKYNFTFCVFKEVDVFLLFC